MKICPKCRLEYVDAAEICYIHKIPLESVQQTKLAEKQQLPLQVVPNNTPQTTATEFRRQCRACGTMWHSLVSREQQLLTQQKGNACDQVLMCGRPSAQMQAKRSFQATQDEIVRVRLCPKCNSGNYDENIVSY
jgi:hypothetical protein